MKRKNAVYAQSGGVTSVINATACGVIQTARKYSKMIGNVYGAKDGIVGILREELIDTGKESEDNIRALKHTPGGAFGSCRFKIGSEDTSDPIARRLFDVFEAHNIGHVFYNGGGDSQDTCKKITALSLKFDYPIQCIGIPKTVDNDLAQTDTCPGFGSVAKYVAVSTREAALDVQSMSETSTKVFILEVMGRHAGWIAAAGGLAGKGPGDPPHIILFPEIPFDRELFLRKVDLTVNSLGYCVIVASEGARYENGEFLSDAGTKDAFGHVQLGGVGATLSKLIAEELGYKYHFAIADYLQRSARHIASQTDLDQAFAVGEAAVIAAIEGQSGVMVTIRRITDEPYRWTTRTTSIDKVANQERKVPRSYISKNGFGITARARRYLEPLIQGEAYPPYVEGLPSYVQLACKLVEKRLPKYATP
ncbi:MAG: 6-phosphofructokinase [Gammaproteobacteria bacterium]|nr:6-phosphofructokinase [Gammaproteobacteria bacterium]